METEKNLQLIAVLPDIIQAYDVRMVEQLHDANLALQTEWDDLGASVDLLLCALDQIGQAQCAHLLRRGLGDDLRSAILSSAGVSDEAYARTAAASNGLAQLPRPNVCLVAAVRDRRIGARSRDLRVALGVVRARLVGNDCGEALVLGGRLLLMAHRQGAVGVGHYGLVVGERPRRRRRRGCHLVSAGLVPSTLALAALIAARRALGEGTSTCWWAAIVFVVHGCVVGAVVACSM